LKIFGPNIVTLQKHSQLMTKVFVSNQHTATSVRYKTSTYFYLRAHDKLFF